MSIGKIRYMKKQSNTSHIRFQNYEDERNVEKLKIFSKLLEMLNQFHGIIPEADAELKKCLKEFKS